MRITNRFDLAGLGKHARSQLEPLLKATTPTGQKVGAAAKVGAVQKTTTGKKKAKPSRIVTDPLSNLKYCPFPSTDPGAWLHTALNEKYGSHANGGDHAHEVIIPGHDKKFRWDHIIFGIVCIELDGYGYHFDLKSFKRDREKQKHALVNGFIVHRVTAQNVKEDLAGILNDIDIMMKHHPRFKMVLSTVGKTQYRLECRAEI